MCSDLLIKDGVKDSCSEDFVMFAGKCLRDLLKEVTLCRVSISFGRSAPTDF